MGQKVVEGMRQKVVEGMILIRDGLMLRCIRSMLRMFLLLGQVRVILQYQGAKVPKEKGNVNSLHQDGPWVFIREVRIKVALLRVVLRPKAHRNPAQLLSTIPVWKKAQPIIR